MLRDWQLEVKVFGLVINIIKTNFVTVNEHKDVGRLYINGNQMEVVNN